MAFATWALLSISNLSCSNDQEAVDELEFLHRELQEQKKPMRVEDSLKYIKRLNELDAKMAKKEFSPDVDKRVRRMLRDCYRKL